VTGPLPLNKADTNLQDGPDTMVTQMTGTSVAASMAAGVALLAFQVCALLSPISGAPALSAWVRTTVGCSRHTQGDSTHKGLGSHLPSRRV
jgi:hypothetical protein